jgi:hypothetical protein
VSKIPELAAKELGFVALDLVGEDIVFRLIIEYNSLRDFGP